MTPERILVFLLRLSGGIMLLAWPAMLLPVDWMAATHAWLGLGDYPRAPLTEYLSRSAAALYAIEGGLMVFTSYDVRRYAGVIAYVGAMHVSFGIAMVFSDWVAGMPWYWTLAEGPPIAVMGGVMFALARSTRAGEAGSLDSAQVRSAASEGEMA